MNPPSENATRRRGAWIALLAVACVVRGGWLWANLDDLHADDDGYRRLAVNLLDSGTFGFRTNGAEEGIPVRPTAYRPPLYPLLLAGVGWAGGLDNGAIAVLHFILGVGTVAVVYRVGTGWRLGRWAALAALWTIFDPILLRQSTLVMTETTATFLAVLALAALSRLDADCTKRAAIWAGAVVGGAALCRPTFLVWFAAIAAILAFTPPIEFRRRAAAVGLFLLVGGGMVALWAGRNYQIFDRPVIATTHGGYTLLLGNNGGFYRYLGQAPWGEVWDSSELDARFSRVRSRLGGDEVAADRWAYRRAWRWIRSRPGMFAWSCAVRIGRLWGVLPHQTHVDESLRGRLQRYAVGVWYTGVFLLALLGIFALGGELFQRPYAWGLSLCLALTAVHVFYWSNLRMRAPLVPVICLAAAVGARWIVGSWAERRPKRPTEGAGSRANA